MKELFEALLAALRRGETAALCTILGASGSAPRGAGAKMAVFADGMHKPFLLAYERSKSWQNKGMI